MLVERIQPDFSHTGDAVTATNNAASNAAIVVRKDESTMGLKLVEKSEVVAATQEGAKSPEISREELEKKVKDLNSTMDIFNRKFHFKVHDKTHRVIVQILDSETGQVVSEIPPEKVLDMFADMEKAIGLVVDVKA